MKIFSKEVQIALVAIAGIVVMFFGLKFLKGMTLFTTANSYYAKFNNVAGLSVSSPIYSNGYRVGVVEDVIYNYDGKNEIIAVLGLDNKMHLPNGTTAEISKDLMGNIELDLILGPNPVDQMEPGDTIFGHIQQSALSKASEMIPQIQQMLPKLDSILANVNMLLSDPALSHSLQNIDQITANLSSTTNELHHLSAFFACASYASLSAQRFLGFMISWGTSAPGTNAGTSRLNTSLCVNGTFSFAYASFSAAVIIARV